MTVVRFWNGNKSPDRQAYELRLLGQVLQASESPFASAQIAEDRTDYPSAAEEGDIFNRGMDVCVTVAGNPKFAEGGYLPVYRPLMHGLLGHRLLIIREADAGAFTRISSPEQLKAKTIGIPDTWADAPLLRANGYSVSEQGTLEDLFVRLKRGECDYVALGVNEIFGIYDTFAKLLGGLRLESTLRLYYPFALVFYVAPGLPELVQALETGLENLHRSGEFERLFDAQNQALLDRAKLSKRTEVLLHNPELPEALSVQLGRVKPYVVSG